MLKSIISAAEAVKKISSHSRLFIGGFLGAGVPDTLIEALLNHDVDNLTIIANDSGVPEKSIGRLIVENKCQHVMASHIGTNKYTGQKMHEGSLKVDLIPQGTLAEQIRAGGAGLGGILTPTGLGTVAQEGKKVIEVAGKDYILAPAIRADIALIKAYQSDKSGNLIYRRSARNFNPLMATAADLVIAEVENLCEIGELNPDNVVTPGIFVDYIVCTGGDLND